MNHAAPSKRRKMNVYKISEIREMLDFLRSELDKELPRSSIVLGQGVVPNGRYIQIRHHIDALKNLITQEF